MERAKIVSAVLLVVIAFGFLITSVRTNMVADDGQSSLAPLPADKQSPAPDWTLPEARGGHLINLRTQARNHPVVFSFWATWCEPCQEELPHVQKVYERYKNQVDFYGISSDDAPASIRDFADRHQLTFPMLADVRRDAARSYGVQSIPLMVVVDTRGKIRAIANGYDPSEDLEKTLPKLLDALLVPHGSTAKE